jgi:hypothetical protein
MNPVIDRQSRSGITTAQARDIANQNFLRWAAGKGLVKRFPKLNRAAQVTGHVCTDPDIRLGRWLEVKVGIKTGYGMKLANRLLKFSR